jgi:hypothetical protein
MKQMRNAQKLQEENLKGLRLWNGLIWFMIKPSEHSNSALYKRPSEQVLTFLDGYFFDAVSS